MTHQQDERRPPMRIRVPSLELGFWVDRRSKQKPSTSRGSIQGGGRRKNDLQFSMEFTVDGENNGGGGFRLTGS